MRFDVYGRMVLVVERVGAGFRVLEVSDDGKRRLRADLVIPDGVKDDEVAGYLDVLLHESGGPGLKVRRIE